jgi:LacI family transcriptional regulator
VADTPVSIREVAALAGVSLGTVSNVLNRPEVVAEPTRTRVQAAIKQLGFIRNESARQLRAGRSRTIGLVVLDVANPFFTDVARGAENVADANEIMVMLCNTDQDAAREDRQLAMLLQQQVLGVLITRVNRTSVSLDGFDARGIPVVLVDSRADRRTRCSVSVNDVLGGRLAVTHLLEQGHTRVAFVGGPRSIPQVSDRLKGTKAAVSAAGRDGYLEVIDTPSLTVAAGRDAGTRIAGLPLGKRPTGVVCANDLLALGLLQEMTRRSLHVPHDIAIVGYDDIEFAAAAAVPLSSVRQPRELLGRTAAELLLDEVNDAASHKHQQVIFEPELIVRDSSDHVRRRSSADTQRSRERAVS